MTDRDRSCGSTQATQSKCGSEPMIDWREKYLNKVTCGDCLELMRGLPDKCVDAVITDPPYGQSLGYGRGQLGERYIANDDNLDWLPELAKNLYRIIKPDSEALVFCQWRTYSKFEESFISAGFMLRTVAIWDKCISGLSGGGFGEQYEQILILRKGNARENYFMGNIFKEVRLCGDRPEHPHQKPLNLIYNLINMCTPPDALILDPFLGSGTTAVAAIRTGRQFIGFEIDPHYCEIAERRIRDELAQVKIPFEPTPEPQQMEIL